MVRDKEREQETPTWKWNRISDALQILVPSAFLRVSPTLTAFKLKVEILGPEGIAQ